MVARKNGSLSELGVGPNFVPNVTSQKVLASGFRFTAYALKTGRVSGVSLKDASE